MKCREKTVKISVTIAVKNYTVKVQPHREAGVAQRKKTTQSSITVRFVQFVGIESFLKKMCASLKTEERTRRNLNMNLFQTSL
jgi:hypothetical protein